MKKAIIVIRADHPFSQNLYKGGLVLRLSPN
jgi:hypothetical protein